MFQRNTAMGKKFNINVKFNFSIFFCIFLVFTIFLLSFYFQNFSSQALWFGDDSIYLSIANSISSSNSLTYSHISNTYEFPIGELLERYPTVHPPLNEKGPIYFIILGYWLKIFSSNVENWYFYGSLLSASIFSIFLVLYYFFVKSRFSFYTSIFSSLLILLIPYVGYSVGKISIYPLFWLFSISALFFIKQTRFNNVFFGIFAGLAHLTHPLGLFLLLTYLFYLLIKRQFKAFFVCAAAYVLTIFPWSLHSFLTFQDFGRGLFFPFSSQISEIFVEPNQKLIQSSVITKDFLVNLTQIDVSSIFSLLHEKLQSNYFIELLILFIIISSFFSFFNFQRIKNEGFVFAIIPILISLLLALSIIDSFFIEFIIIFGMLPLSLIILYKFRSQYFLKISETKKVLLLLGISTLIGFILWQIRVGIDYHHVYEVNILFFGSIFMIIPFGVQGIINLFNNITSVKKKIIFTVLLFLIISPVYISLLEGFEKTTLLYNTILESENAKKQHEFILENIPENSIMLSNNPGGTFLKTGLVTVPFPNGIHNQIDFEKYLEHFNVNYIVIYPHFDRFEAIDATLTKNKIFNWYPAYDFKFTTIYELINATQKHGVHDSSIILVEDLLTLNNTILIDQILKAKKLERLGEFSAASEVFSSIQLENYKSISNLVDGCKLLSYYAMYEDSKNFCEKTLSLDELNKIARYHVIISYVQLGFDEKAEEQKVIFMDLADKNPEKYATFLVKMIYEPIKSKYGQIDNKLSLTPLIVEHLVLHNVDDDKYVISIYAEFSSVLDYSLNYLNPQTDQEIIKITRDYFADNLKNEIKYALEFGNKAQAENSAIKLITLNKFDSDYWEFYGETMLQVENYNFAIRGFEMASKLSDEKDFSEKIDLIKQLMKK